MLLSLNRSDAGKSCASDAGVACSVGIMAYNEEANIADAIRTILGQELSASHVAELIVVASGCEDGTVAMVGGHPIPVNRETSLMGHAVHLQWRMHDRIARQSPKLGEIVAFRNVVPSIPTDTAVDEISIQALVEQLGYRPLYEPLAIVYNRGPTTVRDFLRQRRRIYAGHLRIADQQGYAAPTMSSARVLRALAGSGGFGSPRALAYSVCTIGLEATARGLGHYDVMRQRPQ